MANQNESQFRPEVDSILGQLRGRIRRYVFLESAALLFVAMGVIFWLTISLDWLYFQLSNLELPVGLRMTLKWAVLVGLPVFAFWLLLPLVKILRARALALVLERRFPELDDRLITAVEAAENVDDARSALTTSMLKRTIDDVSRASEKLQVAEVFERAPLRRAVISAFALIISIVGLLVVNQAAVARWKHAYFDLKPVYWDRQTELIVKVIAQPGDRIKEFKDLEYKHPRGSDLTLLVEVPEGKKAPERVRLQYRMPGGGRKVSMSKLGDRQFKYTLNGLQDSLEVWVKGGDFANRIAYRVTVVDPPRIDEIVLQCDYPDYTGLDDQGQQNVKVQGTQVSLPMETEFVMQATTNKPLVSVRIETEIYRFRFGDGPPKLTLFSQDGGAERDVPLAGEWASKELLAADRRSFKVPFHMTTDATIRLTGFTGSLEGAIPLPADMLLRVYLEDTDDIQSDDPAKLTVNGKVDGPPIIETYLRGISEKITRKAVIPVVGLISDDYGIDKARFEFRVDDEEAWRPRPFGNPPANFPKDLVLQHDEDIEDEEYEQFVVSTLDLKVGQKLTLTVVAQDGDDINGPHISRSKSYVFQIVDENELLAALYAKELNLRRQFEQIIGEVEETNEDLILHHDRAVEWNRLYAANPDDEKTTETGASVAASAERALHQINKNRSETAAIEVRFQDILEELVNNRVHTRQMVDRIDGLIVKALHAITTIDYPAADAALSLFKRANDRQEDPTKKIDASVESIDTLLVNMRKVLEEMEDLVKFHEALTKLQVIIDDQEELTRQTEDERKRKLIEDD